MMNNHTNWPAPQASAQVVPQPLPTTQQPSPGPIPASLSTPLPKSGLSDLLFALLLLMGAFFLWHFLGPGFFAGSGVGATVFLIYTIAVTFIYLQLKGIRQNLKSAALLLVAIAASLPPALYGWRDINLPLVAFAVLLCLLWVMYACRTQIATRLDLSIVADIFNQIFLVPFANFGRFFTQGFKALATKKGSWRIGLMIALGLIVSVPIILVVVVLLAASDDGFGNLISGSLTWLDNIDLPRYLVELFLSVPLAAYIFGAVFGNFSKRYATIINEPMLLKGFTHAHVIPKTAVLIPLVLLVVVYIIYFIAVGSYLFSGLAGQLPVIYTYAEYARRGFFELCAVAAINLMVLGGIWLLVKRTEKQYPLSLRLLSATLTLLTCLLIVTAMSKMLIYIDAYGLTQLRLYTLILMVFMLMMFGLIAAWHARPFNAARPTLIAICAFVLIVGLSNTNGIIANYNVDRYLGGNTQEIDVAQLQGLGDGATPALVKLAENATDTKVVDDAIDALDVNHLPFDAGGDAYEYLFRDETEGDESQWTRFNILQWSAQQLYDDKIAQIRLAALEA